MFILSNVKNKLSGQQGFTLAEILVSISIFSVVSIVITSLFLGANNLQQNTASYQRLQNDGRYIIEKLAREFRTREIQYPASNPGADLFFEIDEYGESANVYFDSVNNSLVYVIGGVGENLNAEDVEVLDAQFFIVPTIDPFTKNPATNNQPRVTILLTLQNKTTNLEDQRQLTIQTTVSNKIYKR
jgi:prepilin-type N-terminal cleavage/methylation domain-containing protein